MESGSLHTDGNEIGGVLAEVLRCPGCGDVAAVIAALPDRNVISLHGTWSLARTSE
jgi:hypothetical protein